MGSAMEEGEVRRRRGLCGPAAREAEVLTTIQVSGVAGLGAAAALACSRPESGCGLGAAPTRELQLPWRTAGRGRAAAWALLAGAAVGRGSGDEGGASGRASGLAVWAQMAGTGCFEVVTEEEDDCF